MHTKDSTVAAIRGSLDELDRALVAHQSVARNATNCLEDVTARLEAWRYDGLDEPGAEALRSRCIKAAMELREGGHHPLVALPCECDGDDGHLVDQVPARSSTGRTSRERAPIRPKVARLRPAVPPPLDCRRLRAALEALAAKFEFDLYAGGRSIVELSADEDFPFTENPERFFISSISRSYLVFGSYRFEGAGLIGDQEIGINVVDGRWAPAFYRIAPFGDAHELPRPTDVQDFADMIRRRYVEARFVSVIRHDP